MDNAGRFKAGTIFSGNINQVKMEVLEIKKEDFKGCHKETVLIKDLTTGKKFSYGLRALERCSITILEEENDSLDGSKKKQ